MKSVALLALLAGSAVAAPTATIAERQFDLGSLASNLPNFGGSSTSSSSGSSTTSASSGGETGVNAIPDISSLLGGDNGGITENGVTQNKGCQPLTFIFARGTTELGNMGSVVGPPVAKQLSSLTNNKVTVQGVDYPADAAGNVSMGSSGGPQMAKLVKQALQQCPDTKVVLGGYSQGSMVVHNAANSLSDGQVTAAVLFGDPFKMLNVGKLSSDKVKEFCAAGDPVCENGFNVIAHLSYGSEAQTAAQFLVKAAGVSS